MPSPKDPRKRSKIQNLLASIELQRVVRLFAIRVGSLVAPAFSRRKRPALARFHATLRKLGKDDVAIDCGANVGKYARMMAATGAQVFAFEPNPHAFAVLQRRLAGCRNVTCLNKAVAVGGGRKRLYLDRRAGLDPLRYATGSTLLSFKRNVEPANSIEVESVDFLDFVRSVGKRVGLVKMDVEGAEIDILEDVLHAADAGSRIGVLFVEMHDHKMEELVERGMAVRDAATRPGYEWIDLRWH
jgi:FkbM family methyltransferase